MKKGYQKLLLFEILMFLFLFLNSFVWNILNGYKTIVFLIITIIIFKFMIGLERDKHRYTKDVMLETIVFLLIFFLLYYLSGLFLGFVEIKNYYTINGIKNFIIPNILLIALKEYLRYNIITKSEGNKLLITTSILLFMFFDISNTIYYNNFSSNYEIFIFIALTLLPTISTNILCTYLTTKVGYKPNIIYLLIINLYKFLIPIIPNPNEYLTAIITFLLPITLGYKISNFLSKYKDEEINRDYKKRKTPLLIIPTLIVIIIVYFTSGHFKYYAVAIASGSMESTISKGDMVIIEKINNDYNRLQIGDVLAHKYNNVIVVHRIIDKIEDKGNFYFYTKGDDNKEKDNYVIKEEMIVGKVNFKIPYVGLPTVWLNGL